MKKTTLILSLALPIAAFSAPRTGPWTKEQAWEWYKAQPWMRGCNYMPASVRRVMRPTGVASSPRLRQTAFSGWS